MNAMFARPLLLPAVLLAASAACQGQQAPPRRPTPKFGGPSIPDPPAQGTPWTPPETKLPRFLVTATRVLVESGIADPRGCEYREAEAGDMRLEKTHGFVLPAAPGAVQRFVVDWDGVVRPAFSVGPGADLAADVRALAGAIAADRRARGPRRNPGDRRPSGFWSPISGDGRGGAADRSPLKLAMLLRLGRADLAEALFAAGTDWDPGRAPGPDLTDYGISLLSLADVWYAIMWNRAGEAHARADDAVASDAARRLDAFERRFEAPALALGFRRDNPGGLLARPEPGRTPPRSERPLAVLLADQERRAREGPRPPVPPRGADPKARVAALIRDFDQIAERQTTWPGAVHPGAAPIVAQVVAEGDAAVEPLLAVLESDTRLTRSITRAEEPALGVTIHPVVEVAVEALRALLRTDTSIPGAWPPSSAGLDARKAKARELREFWAKNRSVPLHERWFRTLADDAAGEDEWTRAAGAIMTPARPGRADELAFTVNDKPVPPRPAERLPLAGDPLRAKRDPSVTDLLARRALQMTRDQGLPLNPERAGFGLFLSRWDPDAAPPVLRTIMRRILDRSAAVEPDSLGGFAPVVAALTERRADAGDVAALDEFAAWVRRIRPDARDTSIERTLAPLWRYAEHPAIAASARWMFTAKDSPWLPFYPPIKTSYFDQASVYTSPLLRLPPFREALDATLADTTEIGTVTVSPPSQVSLTLKAGGSLGFASNSVEVAKVDPKSRIALRVCDLVAHKLGQLDGTPPFEVFWPRDRRDRAVAAIAEFLRKYGDRFAEASLPGSPGDFPDGRAHPVFATPGRPATAADLREARAVFSLEDLGKDARVVPMPPYPVRARWTTLKDFPYLRHVGGTTYERVYDQDGWVWQAEEVGQGDARRRFFGFVGSGVVARVPAAEVVFPQPPFPFPGWPEPEPSGAGLGLRLRVVSKWPEAPGASLPVGAPVEVAVDLHNRRGDDRAVPVEFLRKSPDGRPILRRGIDPEAWFQPLADGGGPAVGAPDRAWTGLKPRLTDRFDPAGSEAVATLGPSASREAFRLTLGDWFDLSRPGLYRFRVTFREGSGVGEGSTAELTLPLGPGEP